MKKLLIIACLLVGCQKEKYDEGEFHTGETVTFKAGKERPGVIQPMTIFNVVWRQPGEIKYTAKDAVGHIVPYLSSFEINPKPIN